MKCHICAAAGVLMLAGPAFTRWVQDAEAETVSVTPEEPEEKEGVAAVLNRIFRSPVAEPEGEAVPLADAQEASDEARELQELVTKAQELAEREREIAERARLEAERQFAEVARQLKLGEAEKARQEGLDARRALEDAERARARAEHALQAALAQLEQAEDAREQAAEEAVLAEEIERVQAETECEALERAILSEERALAQQEAARLEAVRHELEDVLAQRDAELQEHFVQGEYERALDAFERARQESPFGDVEALNRELEEARRALDSQRDRAAELQAALESARLNLSEAKRGPEQLRRWNEALERLGRRPEAARERENAFSTWRRRMQQDDQSEIVDRLRALDRRLEELSGGDDASDTCNHCDACRAIHARHGDHAEHTAPEPSRRGISGRGRRPLAEPRAPRPPREVREPREPREPREARAPRPGPGPRAGLPDPGPLPTFSKRVPGPAPTPALPPPGPSAGESGCCCCSTCPRCGAPKSDAKQKAGGVSGIYSTPRAFDNPLPTEAGAWSAPRFTATEFSFGQFSAPTQFDVSFGAFATPESEETEASCEEQEAPEAEESPGAVVFGELGKGWTAYTMPTNRQSAATSFGQGYVLKTCSDGECGEKECITCNAGRWLGGQYAVKDGNTFYFGGQGTARGFVYSDQDDDDEDDDDEDADDDEDGTIAWVKGADAGKGFAIAPGVDWFVRKGQGSAFSYSSDDEELDDHGEILAEILELMEEMSIHLEELRGDVRGLREDVGAYRQRVERRASGPGAR